MRLCEVKIIIRRELSSFVQNITVNKHSKLYVDTVDLQQTTSLESATTTISPYIYHEIYQNIFHKINFFLNFGKILHLTIFL